MMKNSIISLFFIIGFSSVLFSQEENTPPTESIYQIGLNIGSLINSLTNEGDISNFQEAFTYKYITTGGTFRFGLGGAYQKKIGEDCSNSDLNQSNFSIRLGFEKQKNITAKWQYYYGGDFKFNAFNLDNSTFDIQSQTFSISPLLGFQFRLTSHLSLQTETSINFYYSRIDFTQPSEDLERGVNITLPNILNLVVEL